MVTKSVTLYRMVQHRAASKTKENTMQRIGIRTAKHLYQLTVRHLSGVEIFYVRTLQIEVLAKNRAQATRIAEREGYTVLSGIEIQTV